MNSFLKKLFSSKEGGKFFLFLVFVASFAYAVVQGMAQLSWQGFFEYVLKNVSQTQGQIFPKTGSPTQVPTTMPGTPSAPGTPDSLPVSGMFRVTHVADGDTITLENGQKLRYIGINAPESVKPNAPVECFGKDASARNKELVLGKMVKLVKDVSETDKYGRLLRYVYLEDGTFVNEVLVREGYARASTFPPDVRFADFFRTVEHDAQLAQRGLWAHATCDGQK